MITFDNRGVGRSRAFSHAYTTEAMADDAVVGARRPPASIARTSTASRWAAWSPSSSRCATPSACARSCSARRTPGGPRAVRADAEVMAFFRRRLRACARRRRPGRRCRSTTARAAGASTPTASRRTSRSGSRTRSPSSAYRAQMFAAGLHNCYGRLPRIDAPTLVVHGRHDRMIPVANARAARRAHPGRAAADPRGVRPPVPDRGARGRRRDRARSSRRRRRASGERRDGARRRAARRRRHPPPGRRARRRRRDPARRAGAHLPRARRALEPARAGAARRGRRRRARASRTSTGRRPRSSSCSSRRARSAPCSCRSTGGWRCPSSPRIVADAGAPVLIAGRAFADAASAIAGALPRRCARSRSGPAYERWLAAHDAGRPGRSRRVGRHGRADVHVRHDRRPQGRPHHAPQPRGRRRDVAALGRSTRDSVSLTPLPMFHIGGIGWAFLGLWNGATTILVSEFDAEAVLDMLERQRVTNAVFVPTMLQMLAAVPGAAERDYSALRSIAYGASPITTPVLKAALRTFRLRAVRHLRPHRDDRRRRAARRRPTTIPDGPREHLLRSAGRPYPWVRAADRRSGRRGARCGPREVGEVWLRAPNVMAGYFNRPDGDRRGARRRRLAAHRRRRLPRRRRATCSSPTGSRT